MKEVLSFTTVVNESKILVYVSPILFLPLSVILFIYAPLINEHSTIGSVKTEFNKSVESNVPINKEDIESKLYESNLFRVVTKGKKNNRFVLLPSFDITVKSDKKRVITPLLIIYDKSRRRDTVLRVHKRVSLIKVLKQAYLRDPFLKWSYPNLVKIIGEDDKEFARKEYALAGSGEFLIPPEARKDLIQFAKNSFALNYGNIFSHILKRGPFVQGHIFFRKALVGVTYVGSDPVVDVKKIGNVTFLRHKQYFNEFSVGSKNFFETLIPLESNNAAVLQLAYQNSKGLEYNLEEFYKTFFFNANWYFDYFNVFSFPYDESTITPVHVLDYYTKTVLNRSSINKFENFIYHYFFDRCNESLRGNDYRLQRILVQILDKYFLIANMVNKNQEHYYTKRFVNFIETLSISTKNKDKAFFNN